MSGSKGAVRNVRCEFSLDEHDAVKAAAAADDRTLKRFCERPILMAASMPDSRLGMVKLSMSASGSNREAI